MQPTSRKQIFIAKLSSFADRIEKNLEKLGDKIRDFVEPIFDELKKIKACVKWYHFVGAVVFTPITLFGGILGAMTGMAGYSIIIAHIASKRFPKAPPRPLPPNFPR